MPSNVRGGIQLTLAATRASAQVAADAARDRFGEPLPRTPEALARPEVMQRLLRTAVRDVRLPGIEFESSNCQNFLVELDEEDGTARTLYAKLPARQLGPRLFANAVGYWHLECAFCEHVASHVPVRVPVVHAVVERGSRFVLLLENVRELPGARLFTNADMAAGTTSEHARRCLTAFAELHAGFSGLDDAARERLLPLALHPHLAPSTAAAMHTLNRMALPRARKHAPEMVTATVAATYARALDRWHPLLRRWYGGALTLVHGDSHVANCFEYTGEQGGRVGLLDFQGVHWSKGVRDVAYFLIHSLEPDVLARDEASLIDHYIAEMDARGVPLDRQYTHDDYRGFSFQALQVGMVAVGLGGFTERESTVHTMLRREIAAVERLDFDGWLSHNT